MGKLPGTRNPASLPIPAGSHAAIECRFPES
jgi:hypothetical protein